MRIGEFCKPWKNIAFPLENSGMEIQGHIVFYSTLLFGHTQHKGLMRTSLFPFVPKKLQV